MAGNITKKHKVAMLAGMEKNDLVIRQYEQEDWEQVWGVLEPVFRLGETYAFPMDISEAEAKKAWVGLPLRTFVVVTGGQVAGTYYIKPNQPGQGSHVCNCGYVVEAKQRGKGVAAEMCRHSLEQARQLGFLAMQYNLVVASNADAVHLWQKMGFQIAGKLPGAFRHPHLGLVEALVMYQWLGE